jgi:hypothetical protein
VLRLRAHDLWLAITRQYFRSGSPGQSGRAARTFTNPKPLLGMLTVRGPIQTSRNEVFMMFLTTCAAGLAILSGLAAPGSKSAAAGGATRLVYAQDTESNPAEFTLTGFSDPARGLSFQRPTSWTQDRRFQSGVRFAGGDEWLELRVLDSQQTPEQYLATFKLPSAEVRVGVKPFRQGALTASVLSSRAQGTSAVTGKPVALQTDRWIFSPKTGKLTILTITGPAKIFDWEGNRDMALSVRLK